MELSTLFNKYDPPYISYIYSRFSRENFPKILQIVDSVNAIASKYKATSGQVALAWLLHQGPDIIPIPGTRSIKVSLSVVSTLSFTLAHQRRLLIPYVLVQYLHENLGALKLKFTPEDLAEVRRLAEAAQGALGDRYPTQYMGMLFAESPPLK